MAREITMPKLSDSMEEGKVLTWFKKEGDRVTKGEPIAEVETEKADMEVEAFATGVLAEIRVPAGESAAVGEVIAVIQTEDEAAAGARSAPASAKQPTTQESPGGEAPRESKEQKTEMPEAAKGAKEAPPAREKGEKREKEDKRDRVAEVSTETTRKADQKQADQLIERSRSAEQDAETPPVPRRRPASPMARKLARERGIDLDSLDIKGSGPGGRISSEDLKVHLEKGADKPKAETPRRPAAKPEQREAEDRAASRQSPVAGEQRETRDAERETRAEREAPKAEGGRRKAEGGTRKAEGGTRNAERERRAERETQDEEREAQDAERETQDAEREARKAEGGRRKAEGGTRDAEREPSAERETQDAEREAPKAERETRKAEGGRRKAEGETQDAERGTRNAKRETQDAQEAKRQPPPTSHQPQTSRLRSAIARRMTESKTTVPHFYVGVEIDMSECARLKQGLDEISQSGQAPGYNAIVLKAVALALERHPEVNASWADDSIRQHEEIHVGFAVEVEGGLLVPVIHNCNKLSLQDVANRARELAKTSRSGKMSAEDFTGATFTVSNLGMFGIDSFTAIINPPQAAILAVGAVTDKAVARAGRVEVAPTMSLTLSCDHRVVDGAQAARFLAELKSMLENPLGLLIGA